MDASNGLSFNGHDPYQPSLFITNQTNIQITGINLQRVEETWKLSLSSTNEWYWKTRDHHTCLHARPYIGDFLVYD